MPPSPQITQTRTATCAGLPARAAGGADEHDAEQRGGVRGRGGRRRAGGGGAGAGPDHAGRAAQQRWACRPAVLEPLWACILAAHGAPGGMLPWQQVAAPGAALRARDPPPPVPVPSVPPGSTLPRVQAAYTTMASWRPGWMSSAAAWGCSSTCWSTVPSGASTCGSCKCPARPRALAPAPAPARPRSTGSWCRCSAPCSTRWSQPPGAHGRGSVDGCVQACRQPLAELALGGVMSHHFLGSLLPQQSIKRLAGSRVQVRCRPAVPRRAPPEHRRGDIGGAGGAGRRCGGG